MRRRRAPPTIPGGRVVVAGQADRKREDVRALEREVGGVEGAEARPAGDQLARARAVGAHERDDLAEDPRFVDTVAAAAPPALYHGERLRFEFERAASRLIEMQTQRYLAGQHRP